MKTKTICFIACIVSHLITYSHPDSPACSNDLFAIDTGKYFFISEIKPFGTDRFVELYNCRDFDYVADMVYVSGMYSGAADSVANVTVPAHGFTIIPAPFGLHAGDAIRVLCRRDTLYKIMDAVMYTISDSSQSIGLCDWYHTMPPSPGAENICAAGFENVSQHCDIISKHYFDFTGNVLDRPRGLCVQILICRSGQVVARKICQVYAE